MTLENGADKYNGFVLRLTVSGVQIELEKILFTVGAFLTAHIQLEPGVLISERVRSVKHYDNYYRKPPPKRPRPGEELPKPMKLCEAHFQNISENSKILIGKYLLKQHDRLRASTKQKILKKNVP